MAGIQKRRDVSLEEVKELREIVDSFTSSVSQLGNKTNQYFLFYSISSLLGSLVWILNELYVGALIREEEKEGMKK